MTPDLSDPPARGVRRYSVRKASGPGDLAAVQTFRGMAFGLGRPDIDAHDAICTHMLIEDSRTGTLAGCFRLLALKSGAEIGRSYSADFYDLGALSAYAAPMTELGRFCIAPGARDPDILRAAWGAITAHVDAGGVGMLFGCTSFAGTDPAPYRGAFAALVRAHLAPAIWAPKARAAGTIPLRGGDARPSMRAMPPLLRSYLGMGGWTSDHAVIDRAMNTLHVFTALEIAAIPPARQRALRAALDGGGAAG